MPQYVEEIRQAEPAELGDVVEAALKGRLPEMRFSPELQDRPRYLLTGQFERRRDAAYLNNLQKGVEILCRGLSDNPEAAAQDAFLTEELIRIVLDLRNFEAARHLRRLAQNGNLREVDGRHGFPLQALLLGVLREIGLAPDAEVLRVDLDCPEVAVPALMCLLDAHELPSRSRIAEVISSVIEAGHDLQVTTFLQSVRETSESEAQDLAEAVRAHLNARYETQFEKACQWADIDLPEGKVEAVEGQIEAREGPEGLDESTQAEQSHRPLAVGSDSSWAA